MVQMCFLHKVYAQLWKSCDLTLVYSFCLLTGNIYSHLWCCWFRILTVLFILKWLYIFFNISCDAFLRSESGHQNWCWNNCKTASKMNNVKIQTVNNTLNITNCRMCVLQKTHLFTFIAITCTWLPLSVNLWMNKWFNFQ